MLATRSSLDTNEGHEFNSYLPHELELDGFNVVPDVDGSLEGFCIDTCAVVWDGAIEPGDAVTINYAQPSMR